MSLQVEFVEPKGEVVRDCPGTKAHICCGYKTIDLVEGCPLFCSYCILRTYLKRDRILILKDRSYVIKKIEEFMEKEEHHILRFGTGELSDSLALDRRFGLNREIVKFFGEKRKALLELKSKFASVEHLLPYLNPYVIVSFSLTPKKVIEEEERRTSPIEKRIEALRKVQREGFFVGLHFDPIVIYEGFERDYEELIELLSDRIDLKKVIWVSLGLLRFPSDLYYRALKEKRRLLFEEEFIRGEDGKFRYLKKERIKAYRFLLNLLKGREKSLFVYLCMERPDVWRNTFGINLEKDEDLISLFDNRIKEFYGGQI